MMGNAAEEKSWGVWTALGQGLWVGWVGVGGLGEKRGGPKLVPLPGLPGWGVREDRLGSKNTLRT